MTTSYSPVPPQLTVVAPCTYSRLGVLELVMRHASLFSLVPGAVEVFEEVALALKAMRKARVLVGGGVTAAPCLVLCLPREPLWGVAQLLQLDSALLAQTGCHRLVVISPFEVNNGIRRVLVSCGLTLPVRLIRASSTTEHLCRVLLGQGTLLQEGRDELLPIMPARTLSRPEREALCRTLQGASIYQQSRQRFRSPKTLYAQRSRALQKLRISGVSGLLRWFT
ncbi:hypothetical protein ACJ8QF_19150 [Serratia sp. CY81684]|uniref:helix-turn-helix transcriptional regulator n=1 Tax=Serratia TaxID=613 RepID=UPI001FB6718C|nr:hypothetical protein [Serratia marcescens]MCW6021576.1 hypothetical protein [Serratia marcescens]UOG70880.1 hypothetical protein MJ023_000602 [Serratia marcescens]BEN47842.1 hypothetical protein SMKC056_47880 [Serratia marcescens]